MSVIDALVPCGPDYTARGRRCAGFVGCFHCDHFMTVRPDKKGKLQAFCLEDEGGCGFSFNLPLGAAVAPSTAADLVRHAEDVRAFPATYREHLARSWVITTEQLEAIINGTQQPGPGPIEEPEHPEIPPGNPGTVDIEKTGVSAGNPGNPEPEPITEPEPVGTGPGAGTPERYDLKHLWRDLGGGK